MTKLTLMRHGQAISSTEDGRDGTRFLTREGRKACCQTAEFLKKQDVMPESIITSTLVRAIQSAELVAQRLGYPGIIEATPLLCPEVSPARLVQYLETREEEDLLLVGHQPLLGALDQRLTGERQVLTTAGVVRMHVECLEPAAARSVFRYP